MDYTTRRVMVMEWVTGVKLTSLPPEEIRTLIKVGQEAFLTQLLVVGYIHGDPHGGMFFGVGCFGVWSFGVCGVLECGVCVCVVCLGYIHVYTPCLTVH